MMTWEEYRSNINEIQVLKDKIKARSLIYQVDAKDDAAKILGIDSQRLYHLHWEQWEHISKSLESLKDKAIDEHNQRCGCKDDLLGDIWNKYFNRHKKDLNRIKKYLDNIE